MPSAEQLKEAILIRCVENSFLDLFSKGKLNGTVHTSVGQEFSAIAFAGQLRQSDFIVSNHRCHGHYLAFTKDYIGLIGELLGKAGGTCGGIGSSQHLHRGNFYSNGIQGGIVPVAAGMAFANKLAGNDQIGVVFIGDGTLGEGVVYEALNLISLWSLPLLIVCENNGYAQSTRVADNLSGDILTRAQAFGIEKFESTTWEVDGLLAEASRSIAFVRSRGKPAFHLVHTYRLNPHSKGDDDRDRSEIEAFRRKDCLYEFAERDPATCKTYSEEANEYVAGLLEAAFAAEETALSDYLLAEPPRTSRTEWVALTGTSERQVNLINKFFGKWLAESDKHIFLGEDVLSPYGGAFKVARDLSRRFPEQVFTTPISEAAITGIANGLALSGCRPVVEIMFGDFITLALDQIVNHSSKFFHMYNRQVHCPVIIRTPMGGRRGYGPTHSQTLDRFLIGIDNVTTVAVNTLFDPALIYNNATAEDHPVIVIENKVDYGKLVGPPEIPNYIFLVSNEKYPVVRISPINSSPTLSIVTYGGMSSIVIECIEPLFFDHDIKAEVIVLSRINPIDYSAVAESVAKTRSLVVVEEGSRIGGIASEVISSIMEISDTPLKVLKIGAAPVPIPSVKSLEESLLPNRRSIIKSIVKTFA